MNSTAKKIVIALCVLATSIGIVLCVTAYRFISSDAVVTNYSKTREDAEPPYFRGWLPEILPLSSRDITTHNNLDNNTSHGEFYFGHQDKDEFLSHLTREQHRDSPPYQGYSFKKWQFSLDLENLHCKYTLGLSDPDQD